MSSNGPPPTWYRKSGFGCQTCGPGVRNVTEAVSGRPMSPRSIIRRIVCRPGPRNVSGADPSSRPAASACSTSALADSRSVVIGFSFQTCLPAASAAEATSACAAGMVRFTMMSTSSWSRACWTVPDPGTPNSAAMAAARSGSRSATNRTSRSGYDFMFVRYCSLIFPAPMTPTVTGPESLICWLPGWRWRTRNWPRCPRRCRRRTDRTPAPEIPEPLLRRRSPARAIRLDPAGADRR